MSLGTAVLTFSVVALALTLTPGRIADDALRFAGAVYLVWFGLRLLVLAASALGRRLRRPSTVRAIDGVTGTALVGFGVKLAFTR